MKSPQGITYSNMGGYITKIIREPNNYLDCIVSLDTSFSNYFCKCSPDSQYFAYNSKNDNNIRLFLADKHSKDLRRPHIYEPYETNSAYKNIYRKLHYLLQMQNVLHLPGTTIL